MFLFIIIERYFLVFAKYMQKCSLIVWCFVVVNIESIVLYKEPHQIVIVSQDCDMTRRKLSVETLGSTLCLRWICILVRSVMQHLVDPPWSILRLYYL